MTLPPDTAPIAPPDTAPPAHVPRRIVLATCIKNEGPFLLEWIAYHRSIGVTDFLLFTNDCTDGSDVLLDRLDGMGVVTHLPNPALVAGSDYFQPFALRFAQMMPAARAADMVIFMDVDEFLTIRAGDGTIAALCEAAGPFHALSVSEVNFSSDNHADFTPGWLTEDFTDHESLAPWPKKAHRGVKTLVRGHAVIERIVNHRPILRADAVEGVVWLDGSGRPVPAEMLNNNRVKGMDCRGRFGLAFLAHHALRSANSFLVKMDRGDAVHARKQRSARYYRMRGRGGHRHDLIAPHLPRARAVEAELLADAALAAAHTACIAAHRACIESLLSDPDSTRRKTWITDRFITSDTPKTALTPPPPDTPPPSQE